MTKRTIQRTPTRLQAFLWLFALFIIPFIYIFENRIQSFYYRKMQCAEPRNRNWNSYGIPIPPGYSVHGLDVSHYSCDIDWDGVKKMNENGINVDFVFMRATKGLELIDFQLKNNWEGAKRAKILRGAYHFYRFDLDPSRQAQFFLDNVPIEAGDLPPVLDIENDKKTDDARLDKEDVRKGIATWLVLVEKNVGVKPIIYCNLDYYRRYIDGKFPNYKIWIANYNNIKGVKLPDGRSWLIWQLSESTRCKGISEKMDFNIFNGSMEQLRALCKP
jgi:lysozyme